MMIQINKVAPQNALQWYSRGWALFKEQSGLWMQSVFFVLVMAFASGLHQLTMILFAFAYPFLMSGLYQMAFNAKHGVSSEFKDLFSGFKDDRIRRVLIQLAALGLLVSLAMTPLTSQLFESMKTGVPLPIETMVLMTGANLIYMMFFMFAVPIVYFYHEQNLLVVLKTSFSACIQNIPAMIIFGLLSMALITFSVFTLFLALIIILPWLMLTLYLAFDDLIGTDIKLDDKDDDDDNEQDITFTV